MHRKLLCLLPLTLLLAGCNAGSNISIPELNEGDTYIVKEVHNENPESYYKRNVFTGKMTKETKGERLTYLFVENTGLSKDSFPTLTIKVTGTADYMDCMGAFTNDLKEGMELSQERLSSAHKSCGGSTSRGFPKFEWNTYF